MVLNLDYYTSINDDTSKIAGYQGIDFSFLYLHSTVTHFNETLDLCLKNPEELRDVPLCHLLVVAQEREERGDVTSGYSGEESFSENPGLFTPRLWQR